jgi:hypothetical protein
VPAGDPDGGQWTDGGAGTQYAETSNDPFLNKHIIERHVDKTDEELKARIRAEQFPGLFVTAGRDRNGSFDSRESARDFISRTIENNPETVAAVASGKLSDAFLTWRFGYQTGREAILDLDTSTIRMRPTYNVGVLITHDPSSDLGYRVVTAFPRNYNPRVGR